MGLRKGFLYTLDALFAALLIIGAAVLYLQFDQPGVDTGASQLQAQDVLLSLERIPLKEIDRSAAWKESLYLDTGLTENDSVLYAIGMLWVLEEDARLADVLDIVNETVPNRTRLVLRMQDEILLETDKGTLNRAVSVSRQQITGIDQGKPLAGTSSSAYLRRLRDKQTSSFAYIGGFAGQGNLTLTLSLPSDASVVSFFLEGDTPQDFLVEVNGVQCYAATVTTGTREPDLWDLDPCSSELVGGDNEVRILYADVVNAYMSGGYLKASYTTNEFTSGDVLTETTYYFPGIDGVVNLFDAVIIPGTLQSIDAHLEFHVKDDTATTYLAIGEKTVYTSNASNVDVSVDLSDDNFTILDYAFLSNKTVPIRFASFNHSSAKYRGGNADVVVITDYSGSMKKSVSDWTMGNSGSAADCEASVYSSATIRRQHLARCLDKEVIEVLFDDEKNITGNRVWPVHYFNDLVYRYTNPEDPDALIGFYETNTGTFPLQAKGETCIGCALSEAYNVFTDNYVENRSRFVILMSDGLPTHCGASGCGPDIDPDYGSKACEGLCDESGMSGDSCNNYFLCDLSDTTCDPAVQHAKEVAILLNDTYNVTVFTVGLGPVGTCTKAEVLLQEIADVTNGTYQRASSPDELRAIYRNISYSILEAINLINQTAIIRDNNTQSTLYPGSYITFTHTEPTNGPEANEIEVTRQTGQLGDYGGCTATVPLPDVRLKEADLVSYSGNLWTRLVTLEGQPVFNLSQFFLTYPRLGDPYRISLPVGLLDTDAALDVTIAPNATGDDGCSDNNTVIYTAYVPSASSRSDVLPGAEGCQWTIEQDFGGFVSATIPAGASQTCSYTAASISYNASDSAQVAVFELLEELDFDGDGRIFVDLDAADLEIILTKVSSVPYLWGPVTLGMEVSR